MLGQKNRLRGKDLFQQLFARGQRVFSGPIAGFSLPSKNGTLVIGVTFKQKAFPRAVTRHRYKRCILAWARRHQAEFPQGRAIAIHLSSPVVPFTSNTLDTLLTRLIQSLNKL